MSLNEKRFWGCIGLILVVWSGLACAAASAANETTYWRFEEGQPGAAVAAAADSSRKLKAVPEGKTPQGTDRVPIAVLPQTGEANHGAVAFDGGWLRAALCPNWPQGKAFTVELYVRLLNSSREEVLITQGKAGLGNWHIVHHADGTVLAAVHGQGTANFFKDTPGPFPGLWYHLAASFETKDGKTRIKAYLNGQLRDSVESAELKPADETDLFLGSFTDGHLPFAGDLDEVRISSGILTGDDFLISSPGATFVHGTAIKPLFVPRGTRIDESLRTKAAGNPILAKPEGYTYFYKFSTGSPVPLADIPAENSWLSGFTLRGWPICKSGSPAGYHIAVPQGGRFVVAVGFYALGGKCNVVLDGKIVDTVEPLNDPFIRKYEATDLNDDGFLDVSCFHVADEGNYVGGMNAVWVFADEKPGDLDVEKLAAGRCETPPMYCILPGREEAISGHVGYPVLSAEKRAKMLPMRPVPFELSAEWPQPPDPLDIEVRGELSDRINTYTDRWGFAGRDQKIVAGFLEDCGYEVSGRNIETFYMLGRLMQRDFEMNVPADALLAKQDSTSRVPGSFVGGQPLRTGFIWSQGCVLSGLMAAHELTGDSKYIEAADKLACWYDDYLNQEDLHAANYFASKGQFSIDGAVVGHLGKGSLEGMVWLYWRSKKPKHLEIAKRIAELNRQHGGVAWMIHGDNAASRDYEDWHLHASLSTVRGFPWLYAATGDKSYLDDAVAACDRVFEKATWGTGGVLEQIPWGKNVDPHDETCQTSDELQLSYLLGDFTGEGRFFDRAEIIYYNHIRYMQMHNGHFSTFNKLPGNVRGGDGWFCCGWWGGKALYETARHLYASSPAAVYVNGFMPSVATLKLQGGSVRIEADADIPKSGQISLKLTPQGVTKFAVKIRVPGWAVLKELQVNDMQQKVLVEKGYATIERQWNSGDRIDVSFDLPLKVALDSAYDGNSTAKVAVDGAAPAESRRILVFRGPVIIAQFTLSNGCDLNWAYSGDHPDLFEALSTSADIVEGDGWKFDSGRCPELTKATTMPEGVKLQWQFSPQPGWTLQRTAFVPTGVPVRVDYESELIAPSTDALKTIKSIRTCGVRMRTKGFIDYRKVELFVDGEKVNFADSLDKELSAREIKLDNGYVQFAVSPVESRVSVSDASNYAAIYCIPKTEGLNLKASCTLTITGQSQFAAPVIRPDGDVKSMDKAAVKTGISE